MKENSTNKFMNKAGIKGNDLMQMKENISGAKKTTQQKGRMVI